MKQTFLTVAALSLVVGCNFGVDEMPKTSDLAGVYVLSDTSSAFLHDHKSYSAIPESEISLAQDGSASIRNLPDCYVDGFGRGNRQYVSGYGTWEIEKTDSGFGVTLTIAGGGTLKSGIYHGSSILIKNREPPFALSFGIGDPDSNEAIVYERKNS